MEKNPYRVSLIKWYFSFDSFVLFIAFNTHTYEYIIIIIYTSNMCVYTTEFWYDLATNALVNSIQIYVQICKDNFFWFKHVGQSEGIYTRIPYRYPTGLIYEHIDIYIYINNSFLDFWFSLAHTRSNYRCHCRHRVNSQYHYAGSFWWDEVVKTSKFTQIFDVRK